MIHVKILDMPWIYFAFGVACDCYHVEVSNGSEPLSPAGGSSLPGTNKPPKKKKGTPAKTTSMEPENSEWEDVFFFQGFILRWTLSIFQSDTKIGDFRLVQSQDVVKIFYKSDVSFAVDTSANVKGNQALRNPMF